MNSSDDALLLVLLDSHFGLPVNRIYQGLSVTAFKTVWSGDRRQRILEKIQHCANLYVEVCIFDPFKKTRTYYRYGEPYPLSWYVTVAGPLDCIVDDEEVQRIKDLPELHALEISPPLGYLSRSHTRVEQCVSGVKKLLLGACHLQRCVLPTDLYVYVGEWLANLCEQSAIVDLELLHPSDHYQLHLEQSPKSASLLSALQHTIFDSMKRLTTLCTLTIPISYVSAAFLDCISQLPELLMLHIKPAPRLDTSERCLQALKEMEPAIRYANAFSKLTYVNLEAAPNLLQSSEEDRIRDLISRDAIRDILPGVIVTGGEQKFDIWRDSSTKST